MIPEKQLVKLAAAAFAATPPSVTWADVWASIVAVEGLVSAPGALNALNGVMKGEMANATNSEKLAAVGEFLKLQSKHNAPSGVSEQDKLETIEGLADLFARGGVRTAIDGAFTGTAATMADKKKWGVLASIFEAMSQVPEAE